MLTSAHAGFALAGAFLAAAMGTAVYGQVARKRGLLANPNFRSLHEQPVPSGGGIVFALVFLTGVTCMWIYGSLDVDLALALVLGGSVATGAGFLDDKLKIRASAKLGLQCTLAAWTLACLGEITLIDLPLLSRPINWLINWMALVWLMNLYNFMDGIDGMAASGGAVISVAAAAMILAVSGPAGTALSLGLLCACCTAFLLFNWPPARLFMGDAGSLFLGYCFGAIIVQTSQTGAPGIWTWLILFGYFAGDTTTTTVIRIFVTPKWYGEHRSHAYQNLARLLKNHLRVTGGVLLYHLLWLLPLAAWSTADYSIAPVAALAAIAPVVAWTFRYGPRLSSS